MRRRREDLVRDSMTPFPVDNANNGKISGAFHDNVAHPQVIAEEPEP